jgi:peptidoglycan/xylan/chitin deacetylase (PgdA/CDA1 family)
MAANRSINVPIGPAVVVFGNNLDTTFDITKGGITFSASTSTQDVKVDQYGDSTVKQILKGRAVSVTVPFALHDLERLSKVMPNSTYSKSGTKEKLSINAKAGYDLTQAAERLIIKPTDPNATVNDWITVPLAGAISDPEYTYNADNERVAKITFTGFADSENSSLYVLGDTGIPKLVDDFSDLKSWTTQSGIAGASDTARVEEGTSSLLLTSDNAGITASRKTISQNFSKSKGFFLRVYVEDKSTLDYISIYLSTSTTLSTFFSTTIKSPNLVEGWNEILLDKSILKGSDSWEKTFVRAQIRVVSKASTKTSVVFDKLAELSPLPTSRPKVVFTMDDGWISQYTEAFSRMNAKGFKGTLAVIPSKVDTAGYVSKAQLDEMYAAGWDLANHTYTHINLGSNDKATQQKEIDDTTAWLNSRGYRRASDIVIYPYGGYNSDTMSIMQKYRLGRSIVEWVETSIPKHKYKTKIRNLTPTVTIDKAKEYVDEAIRTNGVVVFLNHIYEVPKDNADTMKYDPNVFQQLIDYVDSKKDVLDVVTLSEWEQGK